MRRVEFQTFLQGGTRKGHKVFIATGSLGDGSAEILLRVSLNGHTFDAEAWPTPRGEHVIEVPEELVDATGLRGGDPAHVAIDRPG